MTLCAVVIVNYNTWHHVERCLNALSRPTFRDFNVWLVDNASQERPAASLLDIVPQTTLVPNRRNRGFAAANNQAFSSIADVEWFILVNPDAFPEIDFIEKLLNAANKYPDVGLFGSRLFFDHMPDTIEGDGDHFHISGLAWRQRTPPNGFNQKAPFEIFSACAAALMIHADIIKQYGGFDEDFFCYMEDVDLGFRMRLYGQKCLLVPDAIAYHVGSAASGGQHSDFAVYHGHRNLVWTYIKNMPGLFFWLFLPLHCAVNLLAVVWFSLRGQGRTILKAKWDALKGLPRMWRKRKMIQSQRKASLSSIWRAMDKRILPLRR